MKKQFYFLVFISLLFTGVQTGYAQLVGTAAYLQGRWLEIGICPNSAFGPASGTPAGYHPHSPGTGVGAALAEVYDYGHDGWAVGAPPFMGDYTYPGSPFEGWTVQANGQRVQGYQWWTPGYQFSGGGTIVGAGITGYSNAPGPLGYTGNTIRGFWQGNMVAGTLLVKTETRVDTLASAVTMTTKFYNTGGAPITGVYYWRSCDPDNDQTWPGGGFPTDNFINWQNDIIHRVAVTGRGRSSTRPPLTLCTKDCRAVATIYNAWGLTVGQDLAAVWNQTYVAGTGAWYNVGVNHPGDIGIGIVFNIGTIAPGDSNVVSCAYVFNDTSGIDSVGAFHEPSLLTAGHRVVPPAPYPSAVIDTYDACANPGLTVVPVDVLYGDERSWTWSKWTWSPGTGLASTTGVHNTIVTTVLPPTITYTITGVDSLTCQYRTMYLTVISCNTVRANEPCEGDTLFLQHVGDSTGATYYWYSSSGFTSTLQRPYKYPATAADSTKFYVVRTVLGVSDTDSFAVKVHHKPVITASNNGPLCQGAFDSLKLFVTPGMAGMTYAWSGPGSYTSTVMTATRYSFSDPDTGTYRIIVTSPFGCKDTATTRATLIPQPPRPILYNPDYCQGQPFVPYTVTGLVTGAIVNWWTTGPTGGTLTTPPSSTTINTSVVGNYIVWASQKVGSCESLRQADTVRVITTPPPPLVTGQRDYCQFIGPILPLTVTPSDSVAWYLAAVGGARSWIQPLPNINVAGPLPTWASRIDSGCESPRLAVTITVHPKPAPPITTPQWWCQFKTPGSVIATPSSPGDTLKWYGPGVTAPMYYAPTPSTTTAPDTIRYWVTETSSWGCVSDSAMTVVEIKKKPDAPLVTHLQYCQGDFARPLNEVVDSDFDSHLNWYDNNANPLPPTPVPPTTTPGTMKWWVGQTVPNSSVGCASDSVAINVTVLYKPKFSIEPSKSWICQYDSLFLRYKGPVLVQPEYKWTLPWGTRIVNNTILNQDSIWVAFDSLMKMNEYIKLYVSNYNGFCFSDTTIHIRVVPQPTMIAYTKPDVCLGDTVDLALSTRSDNAYEYQWWVDYDPLDNAHALSIISSNSHSSGPYTISWLDTGRHVIKVTSNTIEGCKSDPTYDSVLVHNVPDATFRISSPNGSNICLEDSVQFTANEIDYRNSYYWTPEHDFFNNNHNKPVIWGKMLEPKGLITLKVTDPFGCYATKSMEINPDACCTIAFPNAFAPGPSGQQENNIFKPYFVGYHRFHIFRIVNRWGQTVFESHNSSVMGWDGTYDRWCAAGYGCLLLLPEV
ncbi:MAG: hypothetical protein K0Q79_3431 [Flavipsychrobacter sp.]|nr:hypothetical protein [Flavipsychrobacter sp.]